MKIITISELKNGGYVADLHQTSNQQTQGFADTELGALDALITTLKSRSDTFIQLSRKV